MTRIAADATWLIGGTPLVELTRLAPAGARLLGKLEANNPTGSNKDRAALGMIRHAERAGYLRAGGTIVECSSGDLGLSIAFVGRQLGYRVVLTMPEGASSNRLSLLALLGAEVVTTPASEGMRGAMARTDQLAKQTPGAVCLQAFSNRANARQHAETTAREIWQDTDGQVGGVVVPIGTGGTAAGCAQFFAELGVPVFGVEPDTSAVLHGEGPGAHDIPGLGAGFIPDILNPSQLAGIVRVTDAQARNGMQLLASQAGLLLGPASGAVLHAARSLAADKLANQMIVAVLPDRADHYPEHQGCCRA